MIDIWANSFVKNLKWKNGVGLVDVIVTKAEIAALECE